VRCHWTHEHGPHKWTPIVDDPFNERVKHIFMDNAAQVECPGIDGKAQAINDLIPRLSARRRELMREGFQPVAITLSPEYEIPRYEGDDSTDAPARLMGLPLIVGTKVGLVVEA